MPRRFTLDELVPPRISQMPSSAPLWVWLGYGVLMTLLGVLATTGGLFAFLLVMFAAAFSFQFWTFVAHRGLRRRGVELEESSSSAEGWDG